MNNSIKLQDNKKVNTISFLNKLDVDTLETLTQLTQLANKLAERQQTQLKKENKMLLATSKKLKTIALTDGLTKIFNKRAFLIHLAKCFKKSKQLKTPMSVIMIDIDFFKQYNDTHGHLRGDHALIQLAKVLKASTAHISKKMVARYGGEEFCILLPGKDSASAAKLAEYIREKVEQSIFYGQEALPNGNVTISLGVSELKDHDPLADSAVRRADQALYESKKQGRNRVSIK